MATTECIEVEIKFPVSNPSALEESLRALGFHEKTPPTHERNTLYDTPDRQLRLRGEILRIRLYGTRSVLTHKSHGVDGRHKVRIERETQVDNPENLALIFTALGYAPVFCYEKIRSEWIDESGQGEVVVDHTPIGDWAEIEGAPEWIDRTAIALGVSDKDFEMRSYGKLFLDWRDQGGHSAENMTFAECAEEAVKL